MSSDEKPIIFLNKNKIITFIFITIFLFLLNNFATNNTTVVEKFFFFLVEVFLRPIDFYDLLLFLLFFQYFLLFLSLETYGGTTTKTKYNGDTPT